MDEHLQENQNGPDSIPGPISKSLFKAYFNNTLRRVDQYLADAKDNLTSLVKSSLI